MNAMELAKAVVEQTGVASQASDVGELRIAFARVNASKLAGGWCRCVGEVPQVFWQRENGSHGWMCTLCHRVTQTG